MPRPKMPLLCVLQCKYLLFIQPSPADDTVPNLLDVPVICFARHKMLPKITDIFWGMDLNPVQKLEKLSPFLV